MGPRQWSELRIRLTLALVLLGAGCLLVMIGIVGMATDAAKEDEN